MKRTERSHLIASRAVIRSLGNALCCCALLTSVPALANDLIVEGSIDETPAEIKKLSSRAAALDLRIRELEQRIADAQLQVFGPLKSNSVEYRFEIRISEKDLPEFQRTGVAVSHVRLSIDGQPFSYTPSAVIVGAGSPLPLFLGKMREGKYLMRMQFQAALVDERMANSVTAAWQTIEKTIPVEIVAEAGSKQVHSLEISMAEEGLKFELFKNTGKERPREKRNMLEKM